MRFATVVSLYVALSFLLMPVEAPSADDGEANAVSGEVSIAEKYDTNVDLVSPHITEPDEEGEVEKIEDAFVTEVSFTLRYRSNWDSPWHVDLELFEIANLHLGAISDTWGIGRGNMNVGYAFGPNTISFFEEAKYFTEPDDTEFDYFRNSATLLYKRILSPLWEASIGYENLAFVFPDPVSRHFDYYAHGGFVEVRNTWRPTFSTYYRYGLIYYDEGKHTYSDDAAAELGTPETGHRHTGEIGFEWFFAQKNSLIGAYTFQEDESSGDGDRQIGEVRGEQENLELDVEFDFTRHKGMLLYSRRLSDRFTFSLYAELVHKVFPAKDIPLEAVGDEEDEEEAGEEDDDDEDEDAFRKRTDVLFLTSAWITARLHGDLYGKARYFYRMNDSTMQLEDFQSHVIYLGLEYRF